MPVRAPLARLLARLPLPLRKGDPRMSNMGYCRFRNTGQDVSDCITRLETRSTADISDPELHAARIMFLQVIEYIDYYIQGIDNIEDVKTAIEEAFAAGDDYGD
jgi:hypothetical protein